MKKILEWSSVPFLLILVFSPYLGLLFAFSMFLAGVAGIGFGVPVATTYFSVCGKVYIGLCIFTLAFETTFSFRHCCVGIQTFPAHLKHRGFRKILMGVISSLFWPIFWFTLDRSLKGWYMSFAEEVYATFEYWLVSSWRGISFTYIDFRNGTTTTGRVKNPEETREAISHALKTFSNKD